MNNLLIYLLKVSVVTALFYLCYLLLFSKETFYRRNRILLILTLILPTIIPAIKVPIFRDNAIPLETLSVMDNFITSASTAETAASDTFIAYNYSGFISWIYLAVTGLFVLRGAISLITAIRIANKGTLIDNQFPKVIISDLQHPPFSFFPYVVIPVKDYNSGNYPDILDHESTHVRQGHTFDLLLSELFIAFQWYNPFIWLIKRSIVLNHEYLADHISLIHHNNVKEYQFRLLNLQVGERSISLAHNFNSLIKNRIIMINKKPTRRYAILKNLLILPVVAIVAYAFVTPEYHYVTPGSHPSAINSASAAVQKDVKGIVLNEEGKPLGRVNIGISGTMGYARAASTGSDGRFIIYFAQEDTYLSFSCPGYKSQAIKADLVSDMNIKMIKDPDYKEPKIQIASREGVPLTNPVVVVDGVISAEPAAVINSRLGNELGTIINLSPKDATVKYGEAGKNGATEIYTKKKAAELGIKIPLRRLGPDDFPTFQGKYYLAFNDWVINNIKYPSEARSKGIQGRVTVNYTVEADGSLSKVSLMGKPDPLLGDAAVRAVQASPKWTPAKNPEATDPFSSMVAIKFELPDKIIKDDGYVMVQEMPQYPGGDVALLKFIRTNTNYPEAAKAEKLQGRVVVRFIVNKEGNVEEPEVLKGVHPLLDAEALRVVGLLKGFKPGNLGGKPVNTYYMIPVGFSLPGTDLPK